MSDFPTMKMTFPGQPVGQPAHISRTDVELIEMSLEVPSHKTLAYLAKLASFLIQNDGVLVTPDASGKPTCQCCGAQNVFASQITHDNACVYKPFERLSV